MKNLLIPTICYILFFTTLQSQAQNTSSQSDLIEKLIENIAECSDENIDYTNLLEDFNQLLNSPVDLNTATASDLQQLHFLNANQIANLIAYRDKTGEILSIYELQLIPGFSIELVRNISPLICLHPNTSNQYSRKKALHQLLLKTERNIEKEKGYTTNKEVTIYRGDPWKYYSRYLFKSKNNKIEAGFTSESDQGEPFFSNKTGLDYYSGHLQYKNDGAIQQVNLGDYQVKFGQGLCLWSGMAGGKSSFTTQNAYRSHGIKAYRSADENNFFRGSAITIQPIKNMRLTIFYSNKKRDGNPKRDTISSFVSSILNTGYHRNENELKKKHKLREEAIGTLLKLSTKKFALGLSYLQYQYSPRILPNGKTYTIHDFQGKSNQNISISYETFLKSTHLFGEAARSKSGGIAFIQGANIQAHPQLNFEIIYRNYAKNYHAHFANGFGESSNTRNEEGFYLGMEFHPLPKWTLKAYYDMFEYPWLKSSVNAPSEGHEYFSQIEFTPKESLSLYLRFKQKCKPENNCSGRIKKVVTCQQNQYRLHLSYKINNYWEIRNRFEFSEYKKEELNENGFLFYQDLIYHFQQLPLNISCRYALFDTDSYQSRIYAYENNILYAYSIPAYYNKGTRYYFNLNYKISKHLTLYARYAQTKYYNTKSIGSGTSEIAGNTKSDIKLQAKIRF